MMNQAIKHGAVGAAIVLLALSGLTWSGARAGELPRAESDSQRRRPVRYESVRAWLWANAIRPDSVDGSGPTTDLLPLSPWVAGADIIALGDGTHGTREFYTVKRRIIQLFAETGIARTVVFEGPWPEFLKLNDYVQGEDGDPRELLKMVSFPFWDAVEILELVEWARELNASREPGERVELLGADVFTSRPQASANEVLEFLATVDPPAVSAATSAYACVASGIGPSTSSPACGASLTSVRVNLEQKREAYEAATSRRAYQRAFHSARSLEWLHAFLAGGDDRDAVRDVGLAANVTYFSEEWTEGERLVVWMHNEHIGKIPALDGWKSMGQHLDESHGTRYVAIGTCMLNGTLRVYEGASSNVVSIQSPLPTNYEVLFARAGWDTMIVPLFHPDIPAWLVGPGNIRIATAGYDPEKTRPYHNAHVSLPDKYDAVIYVRDASPIGLLRD
jgi:erythromycin esterase